MNTLLNNTTGTIPASIRTLTGKTIGQSYTIDVGFGDTTSFVATNLCCNLLFINNSVPASGTDVGTQLSSINTSINSANTNISTLTTKTTGLSYSGTTSTFSGTIHGSLDSTSNINSISAGFFDPTSSIQTQLNGKQPNIITTTNLSLNNLTFAGLLNSVSPTTFSYISGLSSSAQTQINSANINISTLTTKTTGLSYSGTTSTFTGTVNGALDSSSTINSITTSYYDPTSSIQGQITNLRSQMMANYSLTCGGNVIWTGTNLLWSLRVLCIPVPRSYGSNGYIEIDMPTVGTIIPYYSTTLTTKTTTVNGFPMSANVFDNLYYKITSVGTTATSGSFVIANYLSTTFTLDATYILIACSNNDSGNWVCSFLPSKVNMPPNSSYYNGNGYGSWMQPNITTTTAISCGSINTNNSNIVTGTGTITSTGLITATGGLSMGNNQNITLASTYTAPSAGQLGYTINGTMNTALSLSNIVSNSQTYFGSMSIGVGTWLLIGRVVLFALGSNAVISTMKAGFGTNYSAVNNDCYNSNVVQTIPTANSSTMIQSQIVVSITSASTYYFYGSIVFTGASSGLTMGISGSSIPYSIFTATRIA